LSPTWKYWLIRSLPACFACRLSAGQVIVFGRMAADDLFVGNRPGHLSSMSANNRAQLANCSVPSVIVTGYSQ
jgi:hypothetical protein